MIQDLLVRRRDIVMALADIDAEITRALVAGQQDSVVEDDRLLDVTEAAERLRVKPSYMYDLIRRDRVPVCRIGKLIRVRLTTIIEIETGKRRLS